MSFWKKTAAASDKVRARIRTAVSWLARSPATEPQVPLTQKEMRDAELTVMLEELIRLTNESEINWRDGEYGDTWQTSFYNKKYIGHITIPITLAHSHGNRVQIAFKDPITCQIQTEWTPPNFMVDVLRQTIMQRIVDAQEITAINLFSAAQCERKENSTVAVERIAGEAISKLGFTREQIQKVDWNALKSDIESNIAFRTLSQTPGIGSE